MAYLILRFLVMQVVIIYIAQPMVMPSDLTVQSGRSAVVLTEVRSLLRLLVCSVTLVRTEAIGTSRFLMTSPPILPNYLLEEILDVLMFLSLMANPAITIIFSRGLLPLPSVGLPFSGGYVSDKPCPTNLALLD